MAQVPNYGGMQVTATAGGAAFSPFSTEVPQAPDMGFDKTLERVSTKADSLAEKFMQEQDEARITEAMTELRRKAIDQEVGENGYRYMLGKTALDPDEEGRGLVEREIDALQKYGSALGEKLTPRQRKQFEAKAASIYQSFYGGVSQHVFEQGQANRLSTAEASISTSQESGSAYAYRPEALAAAEKDIEEQLRIKGEMLGWTPEIFAVERHKAVSALYENAVSRGIADAQTDPSRAAYALGMIDAERGKLLGSAATRLRMQATTIMEGVAVRQAAEDYLSLQPVSDRQVPIGQGEYASKTGRTVGSSVITGMEAISAVGAGGLQTTINKGDAPADAGSWRVGVSQLTTAEAIDAAKFAGVTWNAERFKNDREYNLILGRARLAQMTEAFGGDMTRAYAAYFSDADTVRKAWDAAQRNQDDFLTYLPEGISDKVNRVEKKASSLSELKNAYGETVRPFTPESVSLGVRWQTPEEARRWFKANDARAARDPVYLDKIVARWSARQGEMKEAYRQEKTDMYNRALTSVLQSGGDMSAVPPELMAKMTASEQAELQRIAKRTRDVEQASDPIAKADVTDTRKLAVMNEGQLLLYRALLTPSDFRTMVTNWQAVQTAQGRSIDENVLRLRGAADPTSPTDPAFAVDAQRINRALGTVLGQDFIELRKNDPAAANAYVYQLQKRLSRDGQLRGAKLDDDLSVTEAVRRISLDLVPVSGDDVPLWTAAYKDAPDDLPSDVKPLVKQIAKSRLAKEGIDRDPTDAELQDVLTTLLISRSLPFEIDSTGPNAIRLDEDLATKVRTDWAAAHGGRTDIPAADLLRGYIRERFRGTKVKEAPAPVPFNPYGDY